MRRQNDNLQRMALVMQMAQQFGPQAKLEEEILRAKLAALPMAQKAARADLQYTRANTNRLNLDNEQQRLNNIMMQQAMQGQGGASSPEAEALRQLLQQYLPELQQ